MRAVCPTATIIYSQPIAVAGAIPGAYSLHSCGDQLMDGARAITCRHMSFHVGIADLLMGLVS
jgi:hypothetical protein